MSLDFKEVQPQIWFYDTRFLLSWLEFTYSLNKFWSLFFKLQEFLCGVCVPSYLMFVFLMTILNDNMKT